MNGVPQAPLSSMKQGNKPGRPPVPERPITKIAQAFLDEIMKISAGMVPPKTSATPIADSVAKMWAPKPVKRTIYPSNNPSKRSGFVMSNEIKRPSVLAR